MTLAAVSAAVTLRNGPLGQVGAERIALLRAIAAHGSIAAAAQAVGLSYKGAWDAVQAMNNLFARPVVIARAGGRRGGMAEVTPAGLTLIRAFDAVEAELAHALASLERLLEDPAGAGALSLIWSLSMKTSARNALRGTVEAVVLGPVNAEVSLAVAGGPTITAVITRGAVEELGLAVGREAIALIKSSFVILAAGDGEIRTSARNCLKGVVVRREDGAVNSEIVLELSPGKTITAVITRESAEALGLDVGRPALALIKASHVILAVE
jgi:molybdate transport system regulatory protein